MGGVPKLIFCRDELFGLDADEIGLAEMSKELIDCLVGVLGSCGCVMGVSSFIGWKA